MTRATRVTPKLAAVLALTLASCSLTLADSFGVAPRNRCETGADCDEASICESTSKMCITETLPTAKPLRIALRVNSGEPGAPWRTFATRDLAGRTTQNVTLPAFAEVTGSVTQQQSNGSFRRVSAKVTFVPEGAPRDLPPDRLSTTTSAEGAEGQPDFSLRVLSRTTYAVNVQPLGQDAALLPPMRFVPEEPLELEPGEARELAIVYPAASEGEGGDEGTLHTLRGVALDANGGLANVAVTALDAGGNPISSVMITRSDDGDEGEFELYSLYSFSSLDGAVLSVRGVDPEKPIATRAVAIESLMLVVDASGESRYAFTLPNLRSVCLNGTVEYDPRLGTGTENPTPEPSRGVPGAIVRFDLVAQSSGGVRYEAGAATTDSNGDFSVELLVGTDTTYSITILPPENLPNAGVLVTQEDFNVAPSTECLTGRTYVLGRRGSLSGLVLTPARRDGSMDSAPGATVTASPRAPVEGRSVLAARTSDSLSDSTGLFQVDLDPQFYYDVRVRLPDDSNYPWVVLTDVLAPTRAVLALDLVLDAPVVLDGRVEREDGQVISSAELEAYAIVPTANGGSRSVLVGKAVSNAQTGVFTMLLPRAVRQTTSP
jgi:hypothetical protein